ncbi:hypothetical protein HK405_015114, partial [Cladochytrium tenue]
MSPASQPQLHPASNDRPEGKLGGHAPATALIGSPFQTLTSSFPNASSKSASPYATLRATPFGTIPSLSAPATNITASRNRIEGLYGTLRPGQQQLKALEASVQAAPPATPATTKPSDYRQWNVAVVCAWLAEIGMGRYAEVFQRNNLSGELLSDLNYGLLREI